MTLVGNLHTLFPGYRQYSFQPLVDVSRILPQVMRCCFAVLAHREEGNLERSADDIN